MGCFLFEYEFWQQFHQDLYVFWAKNCFHNAKFLEFGDIVGGVKFFWRNPQKAHPCLISHILSYRSCKSVRRFLLQACARKKGDYKKSQRLYFTYLGLIPHPTKFNQNWHTSSGCRHKSTIPSLVTIGPVSTKLQILPCSIEWLVAYNTVARLCYTVARLCYKWYN